MKVNLNFLSVLHLKIKMTIVTIKRRVYLKPQYLDQNIMKHLLTTLKNNVIGECTKEYGHILSVERIVEIVDNQDCIFTILFEANTLKPEAGKKLTGVVCMIYKDGIFINVKEKQKMLIPALTLKEYRFDYVSRTYINGTKRIEEGDIVDALVTAARYNNKNFSCFGSIV